MENNKSNDLPKISLVTASYNQGQFIETTIQSVLSQDYPHLEYIVLDGNSNDNSVEIIKKYQDKLTYWHSKADDGASAAIQQGKQMCTGELFNWLNSDDYLLPGTLLSLGTIANKFPEFDIYAFISTGTGSNGALKSHFSRWGNMNLYLISCFNPFGQESTFIRSQFLHEHNISIRREYKNLFDVVLYEEMLAKGARVLFIDVFGGTIRHHPAAKTSLGTPKTDIKALTQLQASLFNKQQKIWRRLCSSRLSSIMNLFCQITPTRKLINLILNQPDRCFVACDFIGTFCNDPNSWDLRYK
jgi:glycosyltransferase involved in cell wall biosynthesis